MMMTMMPLLLLLLRAEMPDYVSRETATASAAATTATATAATAITTKACLFHVNI